MADERRKCEKGFAELARHIEREVGVKNEVACLPFARNEAAKNGNLSVVMPVDSREGQSEPWSQPSTIPITLERS